MNRKHILAIAGTVFVAVGVVAFIIMHRPRVDAYANVLPRQLKAIVRIDPQQLVSEAHLSASDQVQLLRRLVGADDAGRTGIDMARPLFAFVSSSGDMGAVARVDDADMLTSYLGELQARGHATPVSRQRDLSWTLVDGQWLMAFDADKALVMGPAVATDDYLRSLMTQLMRQPRSDSGLTSDLYLDLATRHAPLVATATAAMLPPSLQTSLRSLFPDADPATLRLMAEAHADGNVLALDCEVASSAEGFGQSLAGLDSLLRPISGHLTAHAGEAPLLWLCASVDGSRLLEMLRRSEEARYVLILLNAVADVDAIIRDIDGDVAVELARGASPSASLPPLMFTARLRDGASGFREAPYWLTSAAKIGGYDLRQTSPTDFVFSSSDVSLRFGTRGGLLYASTSDALTLRPDGAGARGYVSSHRDAISGNRLYATLDVAALDLSTWAYAPLASPLVRVAERVELQMPEVGRLRLRVVAPPSVNIARSLIFPATD